MLRELGLKNKKLFGIVLACFTLFLSFPILFLVDFSELKTGKIEITRWLPDQGRSTFVIGPETSSFVPIELISRNLTNAVIMSEDARFYRHFGLDFVEIYHSISMNLDAGKIVRGGSTITQQLVKMLYFYGEERTLGVKIKEAINAIAIEYVLNKKEILAWYLNLANFGLGQIGIANAAHEHFATDPLNLSISQSILLATILPSPNIRGSVIQNKELDEDQSRRFKHLLTKMKNQGYVTETQAETALRTGNFGSPLQLADPTGNVKHHE